MTKGFFRFGFRRFLVGTVVIGLILGGYRMYSRRLQYLQMAAMNAEAEAGWLEMNQRYEEVRKFVTHYGDLKRKYERAARYPWLSVEPDAEPPVVE